MIKLITVLLIISSCSLVGLYKSMEIKERKTLLLDFKDMLLHLEREIGYFKEPLPDIFKKLSQSNSEAGGITESKRFLQETLHIFQNQRDLNSAWSQAIENIYGEKKLKKDDVAIFRRVGDFVGQSDLRGQKSHFDMTNAMLDRQLEDADGESKTKGQMFAKMGVSIGIVIAIVFI